jgi:hypothetical protein
MAGFLVLDTRPVPAERMMPQLTPEQAEAGMDLVSPGSAKATGFSILEADSLDDAVRLVEIHPHFPHAGRNHRRPRIPRDAGNRRLSRPP